MGISTAVVDVQVPWYDNRPCGASFKLSFLVGQQRVNDLGQHAVRVLHFLSNLQWRHTPVFGMHGTTWVELLLAYLLSGGTLDATEGLRFQKADFSVVEKQFKGVINTSHCFPCARGHLRTVPHQ